MKREFFLASALLLLMFSSASATNVKGRVLADGKPIAGVQVSDGDIIVKTDANGRYAMDSEKKNETVFITTPSGYVAQSADGVRPGFWQYLVLPVDQEEVHDFALQSEDQSKYSVMFITDVHFVNDPRREDLRRYNEQVRPVLLAEADKAAKKGPVYTFNLGDLSHDIYWYEFDFDESDALELLQEKGPKTPIYSVTGNHDNDGAIVGEDVDKRAAWRYRNVWGPDRYAVNIGNEHWIFLDDICYNNIEGKGKIAPGIKGDRSYDEKLTASQIEWLKKDLAEVSRDKRVCICVHCPVLKSSGKGYYFPKKQVEVLNNLGEAFDNGITVYAGHIHRFDICDNENYPYLHQISLPATSGIMWEGLIDWPLTCSDGCDAGVWVAEFEGAKASDHFTTFEYGEKYFEVYDMNEVGKAYRKNPVVKTQQKMFKGTRLDYGQSKYRNYVYVNYYTWRPGDVVEMFENGKALKAETAQNEDPRKNFSFELPNVEDGKVTRHSPKAKDSTAHMYEFKTSGPKTTVTVRISDCNGKVRYEQTFKRPIAFDPAKRVNE